MNLVIVQHIGNNGKYIFSVPDDKTLKSGDKVLCQTKRGEQLAVCVCDSFLLPDDAANVILPYMGASKAVKPIIGTFTSERWEEQQ